MQDGRKVVRSIPYVFVAFFVGLKQNRNAYRSSKISSRADCIFEIQQLWQSGFSRVYSNCCCSCSFEPEIMKIGQSSHKMFSNSILNFQESTTILDAYKKCLETYWRHYVLIPSNVPLKNTLVIFKSYCLMTNLQYSTNIENGKEISMRSICVIFYLINH